MSLSALKRWRQLCEDIVEGDEPLPGDVVKAFQELGSMQRGAPEKAMLRVQHIAGGGVISSLVEHVGDITHRMSHMVKYKTALGREKIVKTLDWLNSEYGFEREMEENIRSNARYRKIDPDQLRNQVRNALRHYAEEHSKLPVYNKAQWLARQAAVFVGLERFDDARKCLRMLLAMCPDDASYKEKAFEFSRNPDGSLRQYSP